MATYLVDTNVLVDHLRGQQHAKNFLEQHTPALSHVTIGELIEGVKNQRDLRAVHQAIKDLEPIAIDPSVSERAIELMKEHFLSHHLELLDALIAATAIEYRLTLVTANVKHFSFIKGVKIESWQETS